GIFLIKADWSLVDSHRNALFWLLILALDGLRKFPRQSMSLCPPAASRIRPASPCEISTIFTPTTLRWWVHIPDYGTALAAVRSRGLESSTDLETKSAKGGYVVRRSPDDRRREQRASEFGRSRRIKAGKGDLGTRHSACRGIGAVWLQ